MQTCIQGGILGHAIGQAANSGCCVGAMARAVIRVRCSADGRPAVYCSGAVDVHGGGILELLMGLPDALKAHCMGHSQQCKRVRLVAEAGCGQSKLL